LGVDEVLVYCVNDGAVMQAWAADQMISGSLITFLADTRCEFTSAIGMCIDHPGPKGALGNVRCKRFVLICEDGVVKHVEVSEAPGDPAGDNEPNGPITAKTRVEHILELLETPETAVENKAFASFNI
jgi:peroxiredoxin